jgi:hypothetical protein
MISAETTQITTSQPFDMTGIYMQEEIRTRADIKNYIDKKIDDMTLTFTTDSQNFMNKNIAVFDKRMHDLAQSWVIRITITIFTTILLAHLAYYFIRRKIEKKQRPNIKNIRTDGIRPEEAGIITTEYLAKITATKELPNKPETIIEDKQYPYNIQQTISKKEIRKAKKEERKKNKEIKKLEKQKKEHEEYLIKQKKIFVEKHKKEQKVMDEIKKYEESKNNVIKKIDKLMGVANEIDKPINKPTNNNTEVDERRPEEEL